MLFPSTTSLTPADERLRAHDITSDDGKLLGFPRDPAGSDPPPGTGVSRWPHYAAFDLVAHRNVPADATVNQGKASVPTLV